MSFYHKNNIIRRGYLFCIGTEKIKYKLSYHAQFAILLFIFVIILHQT